MACQKSVYLSPGHPQFFGDRISSAYSDFLVLRRFLSELAWETEAWCASDPTHMIHLNGEKFLGPYS
ncbi:BsuBI/PstI family type II restriction endonuclease [Dermabacter hominis]|uniref:BsuBI/PstI family type II restriction endonuclease n=1 Tax=Dermabacter hominis TaxID=36740 RepID=UPI001CE40F9F|nr:MULTISPECIES: BsuBI/PstI family type II restriction endonuclease [Micrococcales]